MYIFSKVIILHFILLFLTGCLQPIQGQSSSSWMVPEVDQAERLRTKVLHSKPIGGVWTRREFQNRVSAGGDDQGGYSSYDLTGQGSGVIPNDAVLIRSK